MRETVTIRGRMYAVGDTQNYISTGGEVIWVFILWVPEAHLNI